MCVCVCVKWMIWDLSYFFSVLHVLTTFVDGAESWVCGEILVEYSVVGWMVPSRCWHFDVIWKRVEDSMWVCSKELWLVGADA